MAPSAQPPDILPRVIQRIAVDVVTLHSLCVSAMATATRALGRGRWKEGLSPVSARVWLRLVAFVHRVIRAAQACRAFRIGEWHALSLSVRARLEADSAQPESERDLIHAHSRGDVRKSIALIVKRADDSNLSVRKVSAFSSHRGSNYTTVGVLMKRLQTKAQAWAVAHGWS